MAHSTYGPRIVCRRILKLPEYCVVNVIYLYNKAKPETNHMIAVLKSDCFLVSQESDIIGCYNNRFLCYHINAEASTTQQRAALRKLTIFLGVVCKQANFLVVWVQSPNQLKNTLDTFLKQWCV